MPPKIWRPKAKHNYKPIIYTDVNDDLYVLKRLGKFMTRSPTWNPCLLTDLSYHQIRVRRRDQEKVVFFTPSGKRKHSKWYLLDPKMHPHSTLQWCCSCMMIRLYCLMKHATLSIFQTHQRILYLMTTSLSIIFFYFLTTSQLFYITFLVLCKFLHSFVIPLNSVNVTSSRI